MAGDPIWERDDSIRDDVGGAGDAPTGSPDGTRDVGDGGAAGSADSDDAGDGEPFDLESCLREHSQVFTAMGVFGAVGVYLTQTAESLPDVSDHHIRLGVMASFAVFFMGMYVVGRTVFAAHAERTIDNVFSFRADRHDVEFVFFTVALALLGWSFVGVVASFPDVFGSLALLFFFIAGWTVFGSVGRDLADDAADASFVDADERVPVTDFFSTLDDPVTSLTTMIAFTVVTVAGVGVAGQLDAWVGEVFAAATGRFEFVVLLGFGLGVGTAATVFAVVYAVHVTNVRFGAGAVFAFVFGVLGLTLLVSYGLVALHSGVGYVVAMFVAGWFGGELLRR
jgi:hypothetical protein